jgi:SAM-dependent methyltransferase
MTASPPLYLPDGYVENSPASSDADGTPYWKEEQPDAILRDRTLRWQEPVYRFASKRLANVTSTVLDVGCGTGYKLMRHFDGKVRRLVGLDQGSAITRAQRDFPEQRWLEGDLGADATWAQVSGLSPDIVICADVIEHVADPLQLLDRLRDITSGRLVLSTPDRGRLDGASLLGPPLNVRHVREWTMDEIRALMSSRGFEVERARHLLPRSYAPAMVEVRRAAWRLLHGRSVPDPRSCSLLVLRVNNPTIT